MKKLSLFAILIIAASAVQAQCSGNESEVFIDVTTDNFGYEAYWELLPANNGCGNNPIFVGGNASQVGCMGLNGRDASAGNGYGNNETITEGPWCLTNGADYKIHYVDDWNDGGATFDVKINGFEVHNFFNASGVGVFEFTIEEPVQLDAALESIALGNYGTTAGVPMSGTITNRGQSTITSIDMGYRVNGSLVPETFSGLNIAFGESYQFIFSSPWIPEDTLSYNVVIEVLSVNSGTDENSLNNSLGNTIEISPAVRNIIDYYIDQTPTTIQVGAASDGINIPRDLDFHPDLKRGELWVLNKDAENTGGSTVTFHKAGKSGQSSDHVRDGNAWHFMALPTSIAFGDNGNFATSPGIQDANHQPGGSFTGPTLWSSDLSVYGVVGNPSSAAFNGSHLDMLHGSPFSMGIEHWKENAYWVFDSENRELVMYDFKEDHGPGQDFHGDAVVQRYSEIILTRANDHVPSHMALDKSTGWLYIVEHAGARVLRVNTNSGSVNQPLALINEQLAAHEEVTGVQWEEYISTGLTEPTGVAVMFGRLLVSDYSTGEIVIYDIEGADPIELGRLSTGATELMGIEIGPEGFIWFVDAGENSVSKMEVDVPDVFPVGIESPEAAMNVKVYPQPAANDVFIDFGGTGNFNFALYNAIGERVLSGKSDQSRIKLGTADLARGVYQLEVTSAGSSTSTKVMLVD